MTAYEKILAYTRELLTSIESLILKATCSDCKASEAQFSIYEIRPRKWRFITDEGEIDIINSQIARVKCKICKKVQTLHPSFSVPNKRYVIEDIERLSRSYDRKDRTRYKDEVTHQNDSVKRSLFYVVNEQSVEGIRRLHASTLWRWLSWFGSLEDYLREIIHRVRQLKPESLLHRFVPKIHPMKFRSQTREVCLESCSILFRTLDEYSSIIPSNATTNP